MKLATFAIFATVPALASSKPVGIHLQSESTAATASILYTSAGGLELSASKCVDRSSFCGRYKRTDCPQSKAAVASSVKIANANDRAMFIHLLQDGTLTFDVGTDGCVNPVASWSDEPTHGAKIQHGTSHAFITTSGTGLDLLSSNGFSVQGGAIEPDCTCTNGIAHTGSCMAHEDHHCASCEPGFWLDGKTCAPFTVCKAGEHEDVAPVQTKSDRVCTENDSGTFTSASGQVNAVTWSTCGTGEGMISEGTATKDRECGQCEPGKSFSNSVDGEPCTKVNDCTDGEYERVAPTLTSDRTCATHAAECSSHEYESQAPSGTQDRQCKANVCHCPNGSHTTGWACPKHGDPMCAYCSGAYHLANGNRQCDANICSCKHGAVATGAACTVHGATKCTSCNEGYHLEGEDCVFTSAYIKFTAEYTLQGGADIGDKIFAVRARTGHYQIPKSAQDIACAAFDSRPCTHGEMTEAQQTVGAEWCACSHVSDSSNSFYPMQSGGSSGCGGPNPGVRDCGASNEYDVCCYRPAKTHYEKFANFSMSGIHFGDEIFAVRDREHYTIPKTNAVDACAAHSARVCTHSEMTEAQQTVGAEWCACSHVSDSSNSFYPMQSGGSSGCGGPNPGVRDCGTSNVYDVCCYKESAPQYTVFSNTYTMTEGSNAGDKIFAVARKGNGYLHYLIPHSEEHQACAAHGASVCTLGEMTEAQQKNGAEWCACSHVSDSSNSFYPMQSGGSSGCGGPSPGVRDCGSSSNRDVCCVLPAPDKYEVFTSKYTMNGGVNHMDQIFGVRIKGAHYKVQQYKENQACAAHGARVCTHNEMTLAQQNDGAQWCACSHVLDSSNSFYPMQSGGSGGCGGPDPGVRDCGSSDQRDVCCIIEAAPEQKYEVFTAEYALTNNFKNFGQKVFAVRAKGFHYEVPESMEKAACGAFDAHVCTLAEMTEAQQTVGAQWCACSHVSGSSSSFYPMQSGGSSGCGGSSPGVRDCGSMSKSDVCCIKKN